MFPVISSFISFFFDMMEPTSFFGVSFLIIAVVSSIGLMVSMLRRTMTR